MSACQHVNTLGRRSVRTRLRLASFARQSVNYEAVDEIWQIVHVQSASRTSAQQRNVPVLTQHHSSIGLGDAEAGEIVKVDVL